MLTIDIVALVATLVFLLLGILLGFGKGFKFLLKGVVGTLFSIVLTYLLLGFVCSIPFVRDLMDKMLLGLDNANNWFTSFLITIHIEVFVVGVVLFIILTLLRILIAHLICNIFEIDNKVMNFVNKILGTILSLFVGFTLLLLFFQIMYLTTNGIEGAFYLNNVKGSVFGLDALYINNPLNQIFKSIKDIK